MFNSWKEALLTIMGQNDFSQFKTFNKNVSFYEAVEGGFFLITPFAGLMLVECISGVEPDFSFTNEMDEKVYLYFVAE